MKEELKAKIQMNSVSLDINLVLSLIVKFSKEETVL